jgi:hypothetical protein
MAQPTNLVSKFNIKGDREDLIEAITNTSPEKTPVVSSFGRETATNTYHEWQRDSLRAANKDNAAIDGDDATLSARAATSRVANYSQIFQDAIGTSRRSNKVKKAGRKSEQAYQIAKSYKELQRDVESMVLSSNVAAAGNNTTASKSAGAGVLIYSNISVGAGGAVSAHTAGAATVAPTAGTARAFTEALLRSVAQSSFTNCGEVPSMVVLSPSHKSTFSGFAGIAVNRFQVGKGEQGNIVGGADVYMSDFGEMEIVPHYLMSGATTVFGFNTEYGSIAYLDGFQTADLAKTGDSNRQQVLVDCCLEMTAENTHFQIRDLTA